MSGNPTGNPAAKRLDIGRLETGGGRIAYRANADRLEKVFIEIGAVSITEVEIVSGLSEGERIVLSDMTLYDGAESLRVE